MLKVPGRDGRLLFWPDQALSTAGMLVRVVTELAPLVELTRWRFDSISSPDGSTFSADQAVPGYGDEADMVAPG